MRRKELKLVITFHTTAEAIALEAFCKKENVPGRLIPIPRQISSGCGLSWSMPEEWHERMKNLTALNGISYEFMGEYVI